MTKLNNNHKIEEKEKLMIPLKSIRKELIVRYYFKVVPRSGLALWDGHSIVNTPGTKPARTNGEIST